jgi:hypothetical protein
MNLESYVTAAMSSAGYVTVAVSSASYVTVAVRERERPSEIPGANGATV